MSTTKTVITRLADRGRRHRDTRQVYQMLLHIIVDRNDRRLNILVSGSPYKYRIEELVKFGCLQYKDDPTITTPKRYSITEKGIDLLKKLDSLYSQNPQQWFQNEKERNEFST